jgi:hypothetical protein
VVTNTSSLLIAPKGLGYGVGSYNYPVGKKLQSHQV